MITVPPVAVLTAAANQRVAARIAASTAARQRQEQQRAALAEARRHGLAARHQAKQTRNRHPATTADNPQPDAN